MTFAGVGCGFVTTCWYCVHPLQLRLGFYFHIEASLNHLLAILSMLCWTFMVHSELRRLIKNQSKIVSVIQLPGWRNGTIWDVYLEQQKVLSILCSLSVVILTFPGTKDLVCDFCGSYRGQDLLDGADVQFGCGPEWRPFQWTDSL